MGQWISSAAQRGRFGFSPSLRTASARYRVFTSTHTHTHSQHTPASIARLISVAGGRVYRVFFVLFFFGRSLSYRVVLVCEFHFAPKPRYRVFCSFFFYHTHTHTLLHTLLLGSTEFYWVLLRFTGFYWVLPRITEFYWVLSSFTGFYRVLLGFTGFYLVLLGFT